MRNLIVSCDGTWNTPDQMKDGVPTPTNVVLLHNVLAENDAEGRMQLTYYHPGVGTDGTWHNKVLGGGTGDGLNKNIQSAYKWLCDNYRAGDRIYLFGYSRGAYTVRSLSGLVVSCGLLNPNGLSDGEIWQGVENVFSKAYRRQTTPDQVASIAGYAFTTGVDIHFLGVWDTVGALGIPDNLVILNLLEDRDSHTFHNTSLSAHVLHARHAVALDEMRANFVPTLWTETNDHPDAKQVWFPGGHGDVGGGWPERGLSDGALSWMIDEAQKQGLGIQEDLIGQIEPDPRDVLHNTLDGMYAMLRTQPRPSPEILEEHVGETLHESAWERHVRPPITQAPYRKTKHLKINDSVTLDIFSRDPWNETGVFLNAGATYTFEAHGEWLDGNIPSGPGGADDDQFYLGEFVTAIGTLIGKVEGILKEITKNEQADLKGSKRYEKAPWFCLMGAIANAGDESLHEVFKIGTATELAIPYNETHRAGYLYCFANDAWHFYGNNRGKVTLKVTRTA
ncbi:MAG: DUF2235 domain-containing protein [Rhodospirillales bacterium]|nr:DUF2235 domain-containing protein [Rhodospirillales bacterium]